MLDPCDELLQALGHTHADSTAGLGREDLHYARANEILFCRERAAISGSLCCHCHVFEFGCGFEI